MIPRGSPTLRALYAEVAAYPVPDRPAGDDPGADTGLGSANAAPPADGEPPALALPMRIVVEGHLLTLISTLTTFNTPMDMTVSELAVETFLPADPETAKALAALGERR